MVHANLSLFLIILIIFPNSGHPQTMDHVELVRCAAHPQCLQHVNEALLAVIRRNMHNTSNPCDNYWDYACGEWTAAPYYDHADNFGAVGNYYAEQLRQILQDDAQTLPSTIETKQFPHLIEKLRAYYKACVGTKSYYLQIELYFQQLPALAPTLSWSHNMSEALRQSKWPVENFNWLTALAELRRFGLNGVLLDESVGWAFNESTKYVIELKMPDDEGDTFVNKQQILNLFAALEWIDDGEKTTAAPFVALATDIYELEAQLRELRAKHRVKVDDEHALTLENLQQFVPNIDWPLYFHTLLGQQPAAALPIELANVGYVREMAELLAQTDAATLAWYLVAHLARFLSAISPQITAKNCVEHQGALMPLGMNFIVDRWLYQTRAHDESALTGIFSSLKSRFATQIAANKLRLPATERDYLLAKLARMQLQVGNLPRDMPPAAYDRYYAAVNLSAHNFYRNHLAMLRFRTQQQHMPLLADTSSDGHLQAATYYINDDIQQPRNAPYFVHQRNLLVVPMLFLQLPFFHHTLHPLLQHSLTGWIVAHELQHGFETSGITLDAWGNECAIGASIKARPAFDTAVRCLTRRPTAALIERIADVNGFQLSFDAYFENAAGGDGAETAALPFAPDFSARQLYFFNFAQFFCGTLPRPIAHDRDDVRVIETLANMPEFAAVYGCKVGERLRPAEQCQMWRV